MSQSILRDCFQDGEGIRREVITADIQSFLGNDATVRPGKTNVNGREVPGYWIKAYRNLTTQMVRDLKDKSAKMDQESKRSGRRVDYEDSKTFQEGAGRYNPGKNSPRQDLPPPPSTRPIRADIDVVDYMDARQDPRDPYRTAPSGQLAAVVTSPYGQQAPYPPSRPPHMDYVQQGEDVVLVPYQDVVPPHPSRSSVPFPAGYSGSYGHSSPREDPRYAVREEPRYSAEEPRHPPRVNFRYPPSGRDDPRYHQMGEARYASSREDLRYGDPRYAPSREDPRYQASARDDPRYAQPEYSDPLPSFPPPPQYDPYGGPIVYMPQPPAIIEQPYQPSPSRIEMQYPSSHGTHGSHSSHGTHPGSGSNSSRKRAAGASDADGHRSRHR